MKVIGIDFTSSPSRRKPITALSCSLEGDTLTAGDPESWPDFNGFEEMLASPGPWIAGIAKAGERPAERREKFTRPVTAPKVWMATDGFASDGTPSKWTKRSSLKCSKPGSLLPKHGGGPVQLSRPNVSFGANSLPEHPFFMTVCRPAKPTLFFGQSAQFLQLLYVFAQEDQSQGGKENAKPGQKIRCQA